jgi:hypothetical protein
MSAAEARGGARQALADRLDEALALVQRGAGAPALLIALYEEAAAQAREATQRGFFLTHAYVHALEAGDPRAETLRDRLRAMGREA